MPDLSLQVKAKPASSGVSSGRRSACQCLYPAESKRGLPSLSLPRQQAQGEQHQETKTSPPPFGHPCCPRFTWPWAMHPREEPVLGKSQQGVLGLVASLPVAARPPVTLTRPQSWEKLICLCSPARGKAMSAAVRKARNLSRC